MDATATSGAPGEDDTISNNISILLNGTGHNVIVDYHHWILGVAGPVVAATSVFTTITLVQFIAEVTEYNRIRQRFRSYVDPILVDYLTEHPELTRLEDEVREMTVAFIHLAGFTTLAESPREKTVAVLSRYTSRMVPVIRRNRGLVNKFMGDGICCRSEQRTEIRSMPPTR